MEQKTFLESKNHCREQNILKKHLHLIMAMPITDFLRWILIWSRRAYLNQCLKIKLRTVSKGRFHSKQKPATVTKLSGNFFFIIILGYVTMLSFINLQNWWILCVPPSKKRNTINCTHISTTCRTRIRIKANGMGHIRSLGFAWITSGREPGAMSAHVVFGGSQIMVDQNVSEMPCHMSIVHEERSRRVCVCVYKTQLLPSFVISLQLVCLFKKHFFFIHSPTLL